MHPVAVTCIKWAVGLVLVGVLATVYGPDAMVWLSDYAGVNATAGLVILNVVISIVRLALMPLGAALVGAAVVIHTLAPYVRQPIDDDEAEDGGDSAAIAHPPSIEG